jgi:hypothetical protein
MNPSPKIITHKMVKEKENIFNPISQKYHDENLNNHLKSKETLMIKESIAKNYDRSLRNEQTYDVINLKDKLKGLESHSDYPIYKNDARRKKLENSKINYNIISNINLNNHNYLPPENRPNIPNVEEEVRTYKINAWNNRDYDIITNDYKVDNPNKSKADREINKYIAASTYWRTHDYDPIQGRYCDEDKNREYWNKVREDEIKNSQKKQNEHHE